MSRKAARGAEMKIMALPRDANPYQDLLYGAMARNGVEVTYLGEVSRSHMVNQLLLPAEIVAHRVRGFRVLHLHWVYPFGLPGRSRHRILGLPAQSLFRLFLWTVRVTGTRLVWTAHNVLPHSPVFWADVRARRWLVRAADLVIAHNQATLDELAALGLRPVRSIVIPHGPFPILADGSAADGLGGLFDGPGPTFLFVGKVEPYKGVEDLLDAYAQLPPDTKLVITGECSDPKLARRLTIKATTMPGRVRLCLRRLTDGELATALTCANVVVLPFREVTTSGSAIHALGAGRPLVIPDLPGLAELPAEAVFRYRPPAGLRDALARAAATPSDQLRGMGSAGKAFVESRSWSISASRTLEALRSLGGRP